MDCTKCGACRIAPSITALTPNMPTGKPAGMRCANLNSGNECSLYGQVQRPALCAGWQPSPELCGDSFDRAVRSIYVVAVLQIHM